MQFPIPPAQPAKPAQPAQPAQPAAPASPVSQTLDQLAGAQTETKKTEIPHADSQQSFKNQIKSAAAGQAMQMNIVDGKIKLTPVGGSENSEASESKAKTDDSTKKQCNKAKVLDNVTLKGGKKSGKFSNHGDVKGMDECQDICCKDKKCNVAFMLGKTCYSVACNSKDLCEHTKAPPSDYSPQLAYVRQLENSNTKGEFILSTSFPTVYSDQAFKPFGADKTIGINNIRF